MNPDTLVKGNALISKFMERSHALEYHDSWNLLIPVLSKLTEKKFRATLYFSPNSGGTTIYDPLHNVREVQVVGTDDHVRLNTWKAVVQFIESLQGNELNA